MLRTRTSLARLMANPHVARALKVLGGTGAAQIIPFVFTPWLTRLYAPSEFGRLATFQAIVAILTSIAGGRYAVAVVLPRSDRDGFNLAALALSISVASSTIVFLAAPFALGVHLPITDQLGGWILLIAPAALLGSIFEVFTYYCVRFDKFGAVGRASLVKALGTSVLQTGFGLISLQNAGLLLGFIVGLFLGNSRMSKPFVREWQAAGAPSVQRMRELSKEYARFPKYDLPASLASSASFNATVLGIGMLYAPSTLGSFALASRVTAVPLALVGAAVGQVYLREAARRTDDSSSALRAFRKTLGILTASAVIPAVVVVLYGPDLFALVFGQDWRHAGALAAAMSPAVALRFVASPLTSIFHIYHRQRALMLVQLALLAIAILSLLAAGVFNLSIVTLVVYQSIAMAVVYVIALFSAQATIRGWR